jgi:hypothetical protein
MGTLRPLDVEALPWDDPSVEQLDRGQREQLAEYWQGRAHAELKVARAFTELSSGLTATGCVPEVLEMLDISIENEREHADLCWRLAARYAGREMVQPVAPAGIDFPRLPSAPAELRPTLHAIGLCCVNENIATVWLNHCLSHASAPLVRAATRRHVSDEVLHARVGWAHLASPRISRAAKVELGKWVLPLLRANVGQWLDTVTVGLTTEIPEHGLPPLAQHRELVLDVVRGIILPGFEHVGIDAAEAMRWVNQEFR